MLTDIFGFQNLDSEHLIEAIRMKQLTWRNCVGSRAATVWITSRALSSRSKEKSVTNIPRIISYVDIIIRDSIFGKIGINLLTGNKLWLGIGGNINSRFVFRDHQMDFSQPSFIQSLWALSSTLNAYHFHYPAFCRYRTLHCEKFYSTCRTWTHPAVTSQHLVLGVVWYFGAVWEQRL